MVLACNQCVCIFIFFFFFFFDFISYRQLTLVFVSILGCVCVCVKGRVTTMLSVHGMFVCVVFVWDEMGRRGGEEGWVGGISYGLDVGLFLLEYSGFYDFYALL